MIRLSLRLLILLGLMSSGISAQAQIIVKGVVVDNSGMPMIGVTIIERGTMNGVPTDADGAYSISVTDQNAVLDFSFIGYKTVSEEVGTRSVINVTLYEDLAQLEEIVVSALGFKEDPDKLGYANSVVHGDKIQSAPDPDLLGSLAGKASGVRISQNSGDPGAGSYIQIRGLSSITRDAQPLIVVDGVPISNDTRESNGRIAEQSRLNDLNPNDIESVTVLKGASAAALWGTKALGGVIMITTKSGEYNQKLKVSFKSTYSIDQISRKYPLQSIFGQGNGGVYNSRARDSWGDKIADRPGGSDVLDEAGEFYLDQDGKIWYPVTTKNSQEIYDDSNFDKVFQNGHFWENNLSLSAGNDRGTAFFSLSDLNQTGIIRNNSDYRRTTVRFNGEYALNDKLLLNANSTYSKTSSNRIRRGASSSGLYLGLLRNPADFDISGYRGDYYASPTASPVPNRHRSYREPLGADATPTYNNPIWTINEQENLAQVDRFINTFKLTYSPVDWVDIIGRAGIDQYTEAKKEFYTPGSASGEYRSGSYSTNLATNKILNLDFIAKANRSFGENFSGTLLIGANFNQRKLGIDGSNITNFIQFTDVASTTRDIDNALPENRVVTSTVGLERTLGVYGSLSLTAFNSLFFTGTLRGETASTFGDQANNTFYFPSASLAWQFNELIGIDVISFAKARASYGEVGVQPARYNTTNVYVTPIYSDRYGGGLSMGLYGNGGTVPSTNRGNSSLRPERKKEFEVGLDLRFLTDRISLSGTYYQNVTEDVLFEFPIANSRGYNSIYSNAAEIQNKGLEIDLGYAVVQNKNWQWQLDLIYSQVRNEVTDLAGAESFNLGGLSAVNSRAVVGQPLGVLWGSRTLRDDQGNIVFDANGFPQQDELEGVIGNPNPDWQGSVISSLRYKKITLNAQFETFQGADIFAGTKSVLYNLGRWGDSDIETVANQNLLDYDGNVVPLGSAFRGVVEDFGAGPVALTEPWYRGDGGFFSGGNDELYIEDGSWTRLREISLSYSLTGDWLDRAGISSLDLSVAGRNLIIWSNFEGNDPDTNLSGVSPARGIDYFNNPGTKSYLFTLILNL